MPRILAIDFGRKRCGIAVTDNEKIIATALTTVSTATIFDFLQEYSAKEKVERFVIGFPKDLKNQPAESVIFLNPFLKNLGKKFPEIPVSLVDERFTSKIASQTIAQSSLKKKARQSKELIDSVSATIILQSYLEQLDLKKQF